MDYYSSMKMNQQWHSATWKKCWVNNSWVKKKKASPEDYCTMPFLCCSKIKIRTSLVVQWLRIRLPMQGTWVRALVQEDPTCCGAAKPVHYSYWACALEPTSHNYWAHEPQLLKPVRLELVLCNKEATAMRNPCTATKTQCSQKIDK